jgi:hypothetical protein
MNRRGLGEALATAAREAGIDLTDEAGLEAFIADYNARICSSFSFGSRLVRLRHQTMIRQSLPVVDVGSVRSCALAGDS